jgi:hypothetical protein
LSPDEVTHANAPSNKKSKAARPAKKKRNFIKKPMTSFSFILVWVEK